MRIDAAWSAGIASHDSRRAAADAAAGLGAIGLPANASHSANDPRE